MKRSGCRHKIILGLTGSFASGKTSVAAIFRSYGARVIDADALAYRLSRPHTRVYNKLISVFGKAILGSDRRISRAKLSAIVFNDKKALRRLNEITHPAIIRTIKKKISQFKSGIIVLDAPLLIEAGLGRGVDKIIVVKADRKKQIQRAIRRTSLSKTAVLKRIRSQMPLRRKLRLADFVIDNNRSLNETRKQVRQIRRQLWKSWI